MKKYFLILIFSFCFSSLIFAHSWYPIECCSGNDCAQIISKQELHDGMLVKTKHGIGFVPDGFQSKKSEDAGEHACLVSYSLTDIEIERGATHHLRCHFLPSSF